MKRPFLEQTPGERARSVIVRLLPRRLAVWLWSNEQGPLGAWGPHVLARVLGSQAYGPVDPPKAKAAYGRLD